MEAENINFEELAGRLQTGIFRTDPAVDAKFIYANEKFLKIIGVSFNTLKQRSVKDIFVDQKKYKIFRQRLKKDKRIENFEVQLIGRAKKIIVCSLSAVYGETKDGKEKFCDVVVDDISFRKNLEQNLLDSKKLFETVFHNTAAAITVVDENDRIFAWNPFVEKMLHMPKEQLFNLPVKDLYPAKEWRKIRSLRARQKGMISNIETKIYKSDRSLLDADLSITVLKDSNNKIIGSIGIFRDITQQKTVERKIKESESKIRIILDNSAAAITLTDEKGRIISWNKFTEHLFGMARKDLYFKPVNILYPKQEWQKIHAENISKIGSKHHVETKIVTKSGKYIDIDLSVNVLRDSNGDIIGSVGIMQDITEQKKIQEMLIQAKLAAEEANSAKSLFLANMSHEVRTPMNTIMGMLDLTMETNLDEDI